MEKKNKNEELQTRREFFKKAASAALPILGVALLASNPIVAKATEADRCYAGYACTGACSGGCKGSCGGSCTGCSGACKGSCKYSCSGTCSGTSRY